MPHQIHRHRSWTYSICADAPSRDPLQLGSKRSAENDEQRARGLYSLTEAQTEYSKALRAAAAARGKIFGHAHETTGYCCM